MAHPPIANLIAHWKMNDNAANTTVVDSRGSYNGTWSRNTENDDVAGLAANTNTALNCTNANYADCGDVTAFNYNTPFSVAVWVTARRSVVSKVSAGTNKGWEVFWSSSNSKMHILLANDISGGKYIQRITDAISVATKHLVATYNGSGNRSGLKIYVNGVRADTTDGGAASLSDSIILTDTLKIGNRTTSYINQGFMDDVRIYNIELSQAQIDTIYNGGAGTEDETAPVSGALPNSIFFGFNF